MKSKYKLNIIKGNKDEWVKEFDKRHRVASKYNKSHCDKTNNTINEIHDSDKTKYQRKTDKREAKLKRCQES